MHVLQDSPVIFNTYQCYLKSTLEDVVVDLTLSEREDFYFGAKIVRGAYMEHERARAAELGYEDPICTNYEATTNIYNTVLNRVSI